MLQTLRRLIEGWTIIFRPGRGGLAICSPSGKAQTVSVGTMRALRRRGLVERIQGAERHASRYLITEAGRSVYAQLSKRSVDRES